jgi:hypothetical protein
MRVEGRRTFPVISDFVHRGLDYRTLAEVRRVGKSYI